MGKVLFHVFVTFASAYLAALAVLDPQAVFRILLIIVALLILSGCVWLSSRLWEHLFWSQERWRIHRWVQENFTAEDIAALARILDKGKMSANEMASALSSVFRQPEE